MDACCRFPSWRLAWDPCLWPLCLPGRKESLASQLASTLCPVWLGTLTACRDLLRVNTPAMRRGMSCMAGECRYSLQPAI